MVGNWGAVEGAAAKLEAAPRSARQISPASGWVRGRKKTGDRDAAAFGCSPSRPESIALAILRLVFGSRFDVP